MFLFWLYKMMNISVLRTILQKSVAFYKLFWLKYVNFQNPNFLFLTQFIFVDILKVNEFHIWIWCAHLWRKVQKILILSARWQGKESWGKFQLISMMHSSICKCFLHMRFIYTKPLTTTTCAYCSRCTLCKGGKGVVIIDKIDNSKISWQIKPT
jgi:hypothetical protein